ncbi:MAG: hypothetical protein LBB12_01025, partial [Holosporaceae bacterium]|nr:hypothetical protein [Holosporaceae bacterium]
IGTSGTLSIIASATDDGFSTNRELTGENGNLNISGPVSLTNDDTNFSGETTVAENAILSLQYIGEIPGRVIGNSGAIIVGSDYECTINSGGEITNHKTDKFEKEMYSDDKIEAYDNDDYNKDEEDYDFYAGQGNITWKKAAFYDLVNDTAEVETFHEVGGGKVMVENGASVKVGEAAQLYTNNTGIAVHLEDLSPETQSIVTNEYLDNIKLDQDTSQNKWQKAALRIPNIKEANKKLRVAIVEDTTSTDSKLLCGRDDGTYTPDATEFAGSIYSIEGYTDYKDGKGTVEPVNTNIVVASSGNIVYSGDNSWYNGVLEVQSGVADVLTEGAMFGGHINLQEDATLIWRGGPKDPNNKPVITLDDYARLRFILPVDDKGNKIFSVYGQIKTPEELTSSTAEVSIESGEIYIKSDCSGFKGKVIVEPGAILCIRKDGGHGGEMFGGTLSVGNGGSIIVKTDYGLSPLSVDLGTITVNEENVSNSPKNIKKITVGKDATVNLDFLGAKIEEESVIRGTLRVGQNADFENLKVKGGTLELLENVSDITIKNVEFGSVLNTMNSKIATISVNQWTMDDHMDENLAEGANVTNNDDGAMQWLLDFDVDSETCDQLKIKTFINEKDTPVTIIGYNVLGNAEKDEYWFQILDIANGTYPEIQIQNPLYESTNGNIYKLYANNRDGKVLMSRNPMEVSGIYLPIHLMHTAALSSLSNVFDLVYDSRDGLWDSSILE